MPTLPSVEPQIQVSEGPSYRQNIPVSSQEMGGNVASALSGMADQINTAAVTAQANLNQISVANAISAAQGDMLGSKDSQLQKKGINALGKPATKDSPQVLSSADQFAQDSQNIYTTNMNALANPVQQNKFKEWYDTQYPSMYNEVLANQGQQATIAKQDSLKSLQDSSGQVFSSAMLTNDYAQGDIALRSAISMGQQMGALDGVPPETQIQNEQNYVYKVLDGTTDALIKDQRSVDAFKMVNRYASHLSPTQADALKAKCQPAIEQDKAKAYVDVLFSDPQYKNPDGTPNMPKINQAIEDHGAQSYITTTGGAPTFPSDRLNEGWTYLAKQAQAMGISTPVSILMAALQHESPGFTNDGGTGDITLANNVGNIKTWTDNGHPANDGGGGFWQTYPTLEAGIDAYLNLLQNGYPDALHQSTASGFAQALKDGGYYTDDVNTYANGISSFMSDDAQYTSTQSADVTQPNENFIKDAKAYAQVLYQDAQLKKKQDLANASDSLMAAIQNHTITDYSSLVDYVTNSMSGTPTEKANWIAIGSRQLGIAVQATRLAQEDARQSAIRDMINGDITTKGELEAKYGASLLPSDEMTLLNSFTGQYKWATSENMSALNGVLDNNNIKDGVVKARIMQDINAKQKEKIDAGQPGVTVDDVVGIANDDCAKTIISKGFFSDNTTPKVNTDGLAQGADGGWYDTNGNPYTWDSKTELWNPTT